MQALQPIESWIDELPKVELHLHLEGAIPIPALWELANKYGGLEEVPDISSLEERFRYKDFPHFIETWVWKNQFLRNYEDFEFIARAVAEDLLHQNIRYAEVFFSPPDFYRFGLQPQLLAQAIRKGLAAVAGINISLIADVVRDFGPEEALRTLEKVAEVRDEGVIGIGLGGSEQRYPPELFVQVFEQARRLGLRTTAHAGEAAGPQSVWGAVRTLHAERIGHGTQAVEDQALLEYLKQAQIPIELCPLSNLRTNVIQDFRMHPVRKFFDTGLMVTVNTDDPKMFGNSMHDEFVRLVEVHQFTRSEICRLIANGINSSFLNNEDKKTLGDQFHGSPLWVN